MGDKVVIAVDGSEQGDEAFHWYMKHLHKKDNEVMLAHASEVPSMPSRESWEVSLKSGNKKREALQEKYTKLFKDLGLAGKFLPDYEKPGEFLCAQSKQENLAGKFLLDYEKPGEFLCASSKKENLAGKFLSDYEKPGEFLCSLSKKENVAYIVMGTRGLGTLRRTIMGSVSDYVTHHAHCPVLVYRKAGSS